MIRKVIQIVTLVILGCSLAVFPYISALQVVKPIQLLGFVVTFLGFVFWYFDGRLSGVINAVEEGLEKGLRGHVVGTTLAAAMADAKKERRHWKSVRILATSTSQIQPLFLSNELSADRVQLILRRVREEEVNAKPKLANYKRQIDETVILWRKLVERGSIKTLEVRLYDFFPTEYNVLFEDSFMISGLFNSR